MENLFKIPVYEKQDEKFVIVREVEFKITYIKTDTPQKLRVVVNGHITKEIINVYNPAQSYRKALLQAISDYVNDRISMVVTNKKVSIDYIKKLKDPMGFHNVKNFLLDIRKEVKRDRLTEFNLIGEWIG